MRGRGTPEATEGRVYLEECSLPLDGEERIRLSSVILYERWGTDLTENERQRLPRG